MSLAGRPPREGYSYQQEKEALMLKVPDSKGVLPACDDDPGKAMRGVAEKLAAHGFDVSGPDWEESRQLTITNARGARRCELTVQDCGSLTWDYLPKAGSGTDPAEITGLTMRVLGAENASPGNQGAAAQRGVSLKGVVGRALQARGLQVALIVYEDRVFYDVAAEIEVINPARPERGQVLVTDDGDITWNCDYFDAAGGDAGKIADMIVSVLAEGTADRRSELLQVPLSQPGCRAGTEAGGRPPQ
jgi:hypothetical protein